MIHRAGTEYRASLGGMTAFAPVPAVAGVWAHLALVRDNGTATFYVNGVASGTSLGIPQPATNSFMIGAHPQFAVNTWFEGAVDEVRVFTFAPGQFSTNDLLVNAKRVTTLPASAITSSNATLNGNANTVGLPTSGWFQWGVTTKYGNDTPPQSIGTGSANFNQPLADLIGGVHHYRAVVSNALGVAFGADQSFVWSPNVLYTWATPAIHDWSRNFGDANTSASMASSIPGELTITETSGVPGGSQAFSDGFNRVRETPAGVSGGLDLSNWDYLEFDLGHNGAGNINVQFFVQATPGSTFVALGPDVAVTPGVNTYQVPLSALTAAQAVYIRTFGINARNHAALSNVVWTLREVRAGGSPPATRDLITHDIGTPEGGLQGAIVAFDNTSVLGNNGGTNQTGLSHNAAGTGSLQWTDRGGGSGGAISWGNGTAWNGNTFNNRITDLSCFDTMLVRISATGAGGSVTVQPFFQTGAGFTYRTPGTASLPIDGQFHDLSFSLAGLAEMDVVARTGINLGSHPTDLVMNVDLVRFGIVPLRITSIERLGSDIILKFRTSLGQQYYVEYSPDLSPGSWAAIGSMLIGNGQEYIVADVSAGLSPNQRFYRVNQLP
ncbi:MAG TPA: LamG-like jellyroll fold domain-containing protein [Verrucomicrobiae bacterium]|nr:LamG-like jellyroll fold domain-containing protein [Verrucomicrobiae bacterium]